MCQLTENDSLDRVRKTFYGVRCNGCNKLIDTDDIEVRLYYRHYEYNLNDKTYQVHVWERMDDSFCPNCTNHRWCLLEMCDDNNLNGWPEEPVKSKNKEY